MPEIFVKTFVNYNILPTVRELKIKKSILDVMICYENSESINHIIKMKISTIISIIHDMLKED